MSVECESRTDVREVLNSLRSREGGSIEVILLMAARQLVVMNR